MITSSETSPLRITSSPSLSPQHTPFTVPSTSQPSNIYTTPVTEEAASMPHELPLQEATRTRKAHVEYTYPFMRMDQSKITKKTVKNGQARTRESEEYKAEARKVKPQSNHGQQKCPQFDQTATIDAWMIEEMIG
ncbi:hypothetical protein Tco_1160272 [Tanacetum coccineum]